MIDTHEITLARLDKSRPHKFALEFTPELASTIADNIGFRKVDITRFDGKLVAVDGGWDLNARLEGQATQNCVISGAPVHTRLNQDIIRKYRNEDAAPAEITHDIDFDDSIEDLPNFIELDAFLGESILLAAPEYPRLAKYAKGGTFIYSTEEHAVTEEDLNAEPTKRPFAGLAEALAAKKDVDEI